VVLDRFYVYQYCSPTRSSFLSGRLPIHVNTENRPSKEPGGVDIRMTAVSEQLADAG
jgi:arylsulfatase A-like enzyme